MDSTNQSQGCHSAIVKMELCIKGRVLPIAQLGPDFLVLRTPIDHPPDNAEIGKWIDGREERWTVRLPEGIQSNRRKTPIS
jgi:hypothetical protein